MEREGEGGGERERWGEGGRGREREIPVNYSEVCKYITAILVNTKCNLLQ